MCRVVQQEMLEMPFDVPFARVATVKMGTFTGLPTQANDLVSSTSWTIFFLCGFMTFKSSVVVYCSDLSDGYVNCDLLVCCCYSYLLCLLLFCTYSLYLFLRDVPRSACPCVPVRSCVIVCMVLNDYRTSPIAYQWAIWPVGDLL